jgi:hypothetical protein
LPSRISAVIAVSGGKAGVPVGRKYNVEMTDSGKDFPHPDGLLRTTIRR